MNNRLVKFYNLPVFHDIKSNTARELSPLELDAYLILGDEVLDRFPLEGPSGERYAS